jgi:hypothetical protein
VHTERRECSVLGKPVFDDRAVLKRYGGSARDITSDASAIAQQHGATAQHAAQNIDLNTDVRLIGAQIDNRRNVNRRA